MPDAKKLRVLCLHGFRTNVQVMRDQTRGLRAALGDSAEFVFLNGPFEASGPSDGDIEGRYAASKPFFEWWRIQFHDGRDFDAGVNDAESTAKMRREADHSEDDEWSLVYGKLDETLEYVDAQLRTHGPFDVVVGFSQGAVLLTVLTMWYLQHRNVQWWKLAVCVCGVPVMGFNVRELFVDERGERVLVPLPSIHLVGKKDPLYNESHALANMWADVADGFATPKTVIEHDSGHRFPSYSDRNRALYDDVVRRIHAQCRGGADAASSRL